MNGIFEEPDSATPLSPEEMRDLIPAHIAYRRELNEAEQENIARAEEWALRRRRDLPTKKLVKDLHKHMLGDVWRWAGKFRAFPNGNGRHARLMADLLVMRLGRERFSRGRESLRDPGAARTRYIESSRAADNRDIALLLAFSRA